MSKAKNGALNGLLAISALMAPRRAKLAAMPAAMARDAAAHCLDRADACFSANMPMRARTWLKSFDCYVA